MIFFLVLYCLVTVSLSRSAELIVGNSVDGTSFTLPLGQHAYLPSRGWFFVGADKELQGNEFALAFAPRTSRIFAPIAPPTATLNYKKDQKNPINGAKIEQLSLLGDLPLVVTHDNQKIVYLVLNYAVNFKTQDTFEVSTVYLISSDPIQDADGKETSGIIGLAGENKSSVFFAAVKPHKGNFGDPGSGIALGMLTSENQMKFSKEENKQVKVRVKSLTLFDAKTGGTRENKAAPLDRSSDAVTISHPVKSIDNEKIVIESFADVAPRIYIPLQVTASDHSDAGACGLVLGVVNTLELQNDINPKRPAKKSAKTNNIILKKAALDSAIGSDSIIAARGSEKQVSLFRASLMSTSTALPYVIVVGGVAKPSQAIKKVFALPIVNTVKNFGLIANKHQKPHNRKDTAALQRQFIQPARTPDQMPNPSDREAVVGGGDAPAPIEDMIISKDAVFISTRDAGDGQKPGIFYSQALFDQSGKISGWTQWARVAGADTAVTGFEFDAITTNFWYMTDDSKTSSIQSVLRTDWNKARDEQKNAHALSQLSKRLFEDFGGGIQEADVFPSETPGFSSKKGTKLSIISLTGLGRVVLIESGNDARGFFGPQHHFKTHFSSHDGTLKGFNSPAKYMDIRGGALDEIGPVVTAEIMSDGHNGWLVVGGTHGIAVLANPDGTGWKVDENKGLESNFVGLSSSMRFITLGSFKEVHKLIGSQNALFVITAREINRMTLSPEIIRRSEAAPHVTLLRSGFVDDSVVFLDAVITGSLGIIATNAGMLHTGPDKDIRTVMNEREADWTSVDIPYSTGGVTRFFHITGHKNALSNLYVLDSSPANDQGRIYRYVIKPKAANPVVLFDDVFEFGQPATFFLNLGAYRGYLYANGAGLFLTGSAFTQSKQFIDAITRSFRLGKQAVHEDKIRVLNMKNAKAIGQVKRDPGSGELFVWTDSHLVFNG